MKHILIVAGLIGGIGLAMAAPAAAAPLVVCPVIE